MSDWVYRPWFWAPDWPGLLAARVLPSERYESVTVVERDRLPDR